MSVESNEVIQGGVELRSEISSVASSANGGLLAIATDDCRIIILNTYSHAVIWEF